MHNRGLVIFPRPGEHYREDFAIIKNHLREIDPGLTVKVAHERQPAADFAAEFRHLPTLVVCFRHGVPVPVPGRVFSCRYISKPQQLRCYAEAGIPFPRARLFQWGLHLDPATWGPLVVMKPIAPGTMSQGTVHLMPTRLVHQLKPRHFAARHPVHHSPMLVQAFVDSGERPSNYRVLTLFGEPLYAGASISKNPRPSLTAPVHELLQANVAAASGMRERIVIDDQDVLAFARRMWHALPDAPLQGLDIIREKATGRLFALESNPGGNTWHFSSRHGEKTRAELGNGREVLLNQFNALERAAKALAQAVELHAV